MRIGWTQNWVDQWYTEIYYYSELLHTLFKIKFYLIYIFTRRHFDKKAIFYSHFEIIKNYKKLYIEIYYYSGKLENDFENFKFEFFYKLFNYDFQKDPETRKPKFLYLPIKLFIIWSWALNFRLNNLKYQFIGIISQILRKYKLNVLKKLIKSIQIKNFKVKLPIFFYFFLLLSIYIKSKQFISNKSVYKPKKNTIFRRLYMLIGSYKTIYKYIYNFSIILKYIFYQLTYNKYNILIEFFLINNNCINAKFLSRYICRKLKQNYALKELINPIKKDLLYVIKLSILPKKSYNKLLNKKEVIYQENKNFDKIIIKNLLNIIKKNNDMISYKYYKLTNNILNINLWILIKYLKQVNKNQVLDNNTYLIKKCYQQNILLFIGELINDINYVLPKLLNKKYSYYNKNFFNLNKYIYDYNNNSKLTLLSNYIKIKNSKINQIRLACINFNRYIKFNYWVVQLHLNTKYNNWKQNNLKSRIKIHSKVNNLLGYKMYLSGRFKRKQRAAYYWFSKGKVPLNTITAVIDYSYFTIPLKNSTICVKIWLYKSNMLNNIYFIKIN